MSNNDTHSKAIGYILWIFGFLGAHRFYYGKRVSGLIYLCTFGLLGIGWLIDLFLIPGMDREADRRYVAGRYDYTVAWLLLTFLGAFGAHRLYIGKVGTALIYLATGGAMAVGFVAGGVMGLLVAIIYLPMLGYDFWTLNEQVSDRNAKA